MRDFVAVGLGILLIPATFLLSAGCAALLLFLVTIAYACFLVWLVFATPWSAFQTAFKAAHQLLTGD